MDEVLARQLARQLKLLNFWITFFGVLFLIGFVVLGFFVYEAIHEIHKAENNLTSLQSKASQTLNVQQHLCDSGGTISSYLQKNTSSCK